MSIVSHVHIFHDVVIINHCPTSLFIQVIFFSMVSAFIHLPRMFLFTNFLFEKRIGQVAMDLLYIRFTYQIKTSQQECSKLANWSSVLCLGPWTKQLPFVHVWWSTFRFMLLNDMLCKFGSVERNFLLISCFYSCLWTLRKFYFLFSLIWNSLFILSTLYCHIP